MTLVCAGIAALTAVCGPRSAEVHYRVTVDIDDDSVMYSGSSVWALTLTRGAYGSYDAHLRGEAVVVDLGSKGRLFVPIAGRTKAGMAPYPTEPVSMSFWTSAAT